MQELCMCYFQKKHTRYENATYTECMVHAHNYFRLLMFESF